MEETISSAIIHETVNRVVSGLIDKYERKSSAGEHMERLEMAQIKLEAALETSSKWRITDAPLLRWRKKLKRAAAECDDTLRRCRQRVREEATMEEEARNSSFATRIAHATRSLVSSMFHGDSDEPGRSAVRRFEWFADGANEFLRFVEFGGTPHRCRFLDPLVRRLLQGETLEYRLSQGNKQHLFLVRPCNNVVAGRGAEARLIFVYKDGSKPEDNFFLGMMLQLSESTDVVATAARCLQLFTPRFKATTEAVRKELGQLPTQDFSWMPYADSCHKRHWDSIHGVATQWFRPDPLCCKQHCHQKVCGGSSSMNMLPDVSLEPVIEVYLERRVSVSRCNIQSAAIEGRMSSSPRIMLRHGALLLPHATCNDVLPAAVASSAAEVIDGEEQHRRHYTGITLEQLDRVMLPRAMDCFRRDAEATAYQMLWKSEHQAAFFHVGKTMRRKKKMPKQWQEEEHEMEDQTDVISGFFNLWVAHAPAQLQGSIVKWVQKEEETQIAPAPLRLKF